MTDTRETAGAAQAVIKDGRLIIAFPVENLQAIVEGAWAAGYMQTRYKITNLDEFAVDLTRELNHEDEDGTTRIHRMFDKAIDAAIDQGAFGIEEHEDQQI